LAGQSAERVNPSPAGRVPANHLRRKRSIKYPRRRIHSAASGDHRMGALCLPTRCIYWPEDFMLKFLGIMFAISFSAGMLGNVQAGQLEGNPDAVIAMGPDPGGHTGAGVTPETTKTDRPQVDAARQAASGSKVENNQPADNSATTDQAARRSEKTSKRKN
ncbi:MAG: hypothetical protein ABI619_08035, partial [Betaproteobacteria bacterium]